MQSKMIQERAQNVMPFSQHTLSKSGPEYHTNISEHENPYISKGTVWD